MRRAENSAEHVRYLLGIEDVSCVVSDALSQLGVGGATGLPGIFPRASRKKACGPAFTVRYELADTEDSRPPGSRRDNAFDFPALFATAERGDIAVAQSPVLHVAVLGSRGVSWARHFGLAGCVINGAVRDVEALAAGEVPVWARHVTPAGGRGSLIEAEVGGAISLGEVQVRQGDLVVADGNGVAVIPAGSVRAVASVVADLTRAEETLRFNSGSG